MGFFRRNGFETRQQIAAFLTVVFSGQIIYSAFESFKIPFYQRLVTYYGLTDTQFGLLFTALGVAVFFYIPGGWVNNRFNARSILMVGLAYRCITALILIGLTPSLPEGIKFPVMFAITLSWGVWDSVFWPAVVKGVVLFSGRDNKGFGLGVLTAFRAGGEATLNGILIGVMAIAGGSLIAFKWGMIVYACLTLPMILLIHRFVPADPRTEGDASGEDTEAVTGKEALAGLLQTLRIPRVWLAGIAGMCVYWVYTTLVYTTPFFVRVYAFDENVAALYATVNAILLGLSGGILGGIIADKVFKSSATTIAITLTLGAGFLVILAFLPGGSDNSWMAVAALSAFAFVTMMAKGIQQAPVAELHLPSTMVGSAMSVNSFMAFACILWATTLNGSILDAHKDSPSTGFTLIFLLMAGVGLSGALLSAWLEVLNRRHNRRQAAALSA
ncbi:MFS transporter [Schaalia sp. Marseille-Q2122]|uniref:MFS transporter n=1 Tax=Schaalia sp. Marseille-Q2122 TaxID=2736604 RepID=UPI00158DAED7|nr:MFS transporter [Schaalia sp. Marseille-Q2122]